MAKTQPLRTFKVFAVFKLKFIQVRLEEAARHQELEDDLPANNSVFIGDELAEMEFFVPNKGLCIIFIFLLASQSK